MTAGQEWAAVFAARRDRAERRALAAARVDAMLAAGSPRAGAALDAALSRGDRGQVLGLISGLRAGAAPPAGHASRGGVSRAYGDGDFDVPECEKCILAGATVAESVLLHLEPHPDSEVPDEAVWDEKAEAEAGRLIRLGYSREPARLAAARDHREIARAEAR